MIIGSIKLDNDNTLKLVGMTDEETGNYLNSITGITATVKDLEGTSLSSAIAVNYIAGSNGNYIAIIPYTLALTEFHQYIINIVGTAGLGKVFDISYSVLCETYTGL